jgi:hypothetical protein
VSHYPLEKPDQSTSTPPKIDRMNRVRKLLKKLESGPFKDHPRVHDLKNLVYETYLARIFRTFDEAGMCLP